MSFGQFSLVASIIFLGLSISAYAEKPITIVAFNAENLFDTVDDTENPRDDTYLPLSLKTTMQPSHDQKCDEYNGAGSFYSKQCKTLD